MSNGFILSYDYYESEYYKILTVHHGFDDKFILNEENNILTISRIDKDDGWGQNLKVKLVDKETLKDEIIIIGKSEINNKSIKLNREYPSSKNHYENDEFKIFALSPTCNDNFKVDFLEDIQILKIKRIDKDDGWGQDLNLKYIEKKTNKIKIINIGKSNFNNISIEINLKKIPYINTNDNYYDDDKYTLKIIENNFNDKFKILFYEDNSTIYIKRIDTNTGWGQKLKIKFIDKSGENKTIFIGSSSENEVYRKIDLTNRKIYASLTTIPSRIKLPVFFDHINSLLDDQTFPAEKLFITIAKKYRRFDEKISESIIERLRSNDRIILIILEDDWGPASKYLAPLLYHKDILENNLLVIVDDDRKYNKNLFRNFAMGYTSNTNIRFSTGNWVDYFEKNYKNMTDEPIDYLIKSEKNNYNFYFGNGLGGFYGFCIKVENIDKFISYNFKILEKIPNSFFHDEGITLGFLKATEENILILKHRGCNYIQNEMVDALCFSGLCDRGKIEKEILLLTNQEQLLADEK